MKGRFYFVIMEKRYRQKAFFSTKFLGFGIDLDHWPPFADREIKFVFQITLFFFRYWFLLYKK